MNNFQPLLHVEIVENIYNTFGELTIIYKDKPPTKNNAKDSRLHVLDETIY